MRRILHVIYGLGDQLGGPPAALATLARAQAARGDDVIVLPATRTPGESTIPESGIPGLRLEPPPSRSHLLWRDGRLLAAVKRLARDRDLLHAHMTWRYHVLAASAVAKQRSIPFVLSPRGNLVGTSLAIKAARKKLYFALFERRAIDRAAALHCATEIERREAELLGLRPRLFVVPNAVDWSLLSAAPDEEGLRRSLPEGWGGRPFVLFVGRIWPIKRLDVLVRAFERMGERHPDLREWGLVIAGPPSDAPLAERLRRLAAAPALAGRVALTGMVRDGVRAALYRRCSLYAQISGQENFGLSVAEALAFGRPCVVTPEVGLAAQVSAAGAGLVCDGDEESVSAALSRAALDPGWREAAGRAALELGGRFHPAGVADAMDAEYERCLSPGRR